MRIAMSNQSGLNMARFLFPRTIVQEVRMTQIPSSEITPEHLYLSRRQFIAAAGALSAAVC